MTEKAPKSSIPTATSTPTSDNNEISSSTDTTNTAKGNINTKGLSCLRCRKKKAKCSKTRPTCTRCARSNQPCEYPDAPPNLTDLSQKVLTLYDTLRQLEGEFLVKYMQSMDEDNNNSNMTDNVSPSTLQDQQPLDNMTHKNNSFAMTTPLSPSIEEAGITATVNDSTPAITVSSCASTGSFKHSNKNFNSQPVDAAHSQRNKKQKMIQEPAVTKGEEEMLDTTKRHRSNTTDEVTKSNLLEPAGWSMSLTSQGLSIHAVTRNISEFKDFTKNLTRQLVRDFGPAFLPPNWDLDAEGYHYYVENEEDAEGDHMMEEQYYSYEDDELDEDEYLVKVPVYSTRSLLFHDDQNRPMPNNIISTMKQYGNGEPSRDIVRTLLNGADTLVSIIESHFPQMIKHLNKRYEWLEEQIEIEQRQNSNEDKQKADNTEMNITATKARMEDESENKEAHEAASVPHHLLILMQQLRPYLPTSSVVAHLEASGPAAKQLTQICILTAYVVSVALLPRIPNLTCPPLPTSLWRNCAEYATMLLIELVLSEGETLDLTYPIILCAVLLAWIDTDLAKSNEYKADTIVHIALRILCGSNVLEKWKRQPLQPSAQRAIDDDGEEEPRQRQKAWQILIASLLYLDVYSATFRFRRPQMKGEGLLELWNVAVRLKTNESSSQSFRETGIILEAQLMNFLSKVISLFYEVDEEQGEEEQSVTIKGDSEAAQEFNDDSKPVLFSSGYDADQDIAKREKRNVKLRKIDVDEVLTLVRDMELWEQELPDWAKWNDCFASMETECSDTTPSVASTSMQTSTAGLVMHMHMIHNMVKILLFRPFSTVNNDYDNGESAVGDNSSAEEDEEDEQQTLTKTTFLDMSLSSADRLTLCLASIHAYYGFTGYWHKAALHLVQDVCDRVLTMFHKDDQVLHEVMLVRQRLTDCSSIKGKKKC